MNKLIITPIDECGGSRTTTVSTTYENIVKTLGFSENAKDDPYKVEASFGFEDQYGRKGFLWCYKQPKLSCTSWSGDGDMDLLNELFYNFKLHQNFELAVEKMDKWAYNDPEIQDAYYEILDDKSLSRDEKIKEIHAHLEIMIQDEDMVMDLIEVRFTQLELAAYIVDNCK